MAYHPGRPGPARRAFLASWGLDPEQVLGAELHHTRRVLFLEPGRESLLGQARAGEPEEAWDGFLVDPRLGAWVSVTVADCMPIWVLDRASGAYAVLHSGWKGTGILATAVTALAVAYGSKPSELSVILGPAIGACCYPVPPERARIFEAEFGPSAVVRTGGSERLDLRAANLALAESLGIGALSSVEACTSCDGRLGSYRREGKASFTRMLACCGPAPLGRTRKP
jgi:copper oxidase (laccase) domain-containing protein